MLIAKSVDSCVRLALIFVLNALTTSSSYTANRDIFMVFAPFQTEMKLKVAIADRIFFGITVKKYLINVVVSSLIDVLRRKYTIAS